MFAKGDFMNRRITLIHIGIKQARIPFALCLSLLLLPVKISFAECKEYKIVTHGDSVEAICVGEPLTSEQRKELEKQQLEQQSHQDAPQSRKADNQEIRTTYRDIQPQQSPQPRAETPDAGNVVVGSYDIKYIPNNKVLRGRQVPGEYSIKLDVKNNGRRGPVRFKLKQTDFSGFETESITFTENFEKDQQKTITTHLPAQMVPFVQSNDWIIEAYKY